MGKNRFRWPLKDDTAVYELQLTLCRHIAMSNGCDEILYGASARNCETEHIKHGYLSRNLKFVLNISTASRSLLQQTEVTDVSHDQCSLILVPSVLAVSPI